MRQSSVGIWLDLNPEDFRPGSWDMTLSLWAVQTALAEGKHVIVAAPGDCAHRFVRLPADFRLGDRARLQLVWSGGLGRCGDTARADAALKSIKERLRFISQFPPEARTSRRHKMIRWFQAGVACRLLRGLKWADKRSLSLHRAMAVWLRRRAMRGLARRLNRRGEVDVWLVPPSAAGNAGILANPQIPLDSAGTASRFSRPPRASTRAEKWPRAGERTLEDVARAQMRLFWAKRFQDCVLPDRYLSDFPLEEVDYLLCPSHFRDDGEALCMVRAAEYLIRRRRRSLKLVLTSALAEETECWTYLREQGLVFDVFSVPEIPHRFFGVFLTLARVVVRTSARSGWRLARFFEGIPYGVPTVMGRSEEIGQQLSGDLSGIALADISDPAEFAERIEFVLDHRQQVFEMQAAFCASQTRAAAALCPHARAAESLDPFQSAVRP